MTTKGIIDYETTGADTGYNDPDSIQPVANAEPANQTIFRRPSENIRERTEVLRDQVDRLWQVTARDRMLTYFGTSTGATIYDWAGPSSGPGDGKFTIINGDMMITALGAAGQPGSQDDISARLSYKIATDTYFSVRSYGDGGSTIRQHNGANNIRFEIFYVTDVVIGGGTDAEVTVEGSTNSGGDYDPAAGPVFIKVQVSETAGAITTDWTEVVTKINAHAVAGLFVEASVTSGGGTALAVAIAEQFLWEGTGTDVSGIGALDSLSLNLTGAVLTTFFAGAGAAGMDSGDTLVVNLTDPDAFLGQGYNVIAAGELAIIKVDEANPPTSDTNFSISGNSFAGGVIPICKVWSTSLILPNGVIVTSGSYARISPDNKLRVDIIDDDTVTGTCGAEIVGADAQGTTPKTLAKGTVYSQLGEGMQHFNDHVNATGTTDTDLQHYETGIIVAAKTQGNFSLGTTKLGDQLNELLDDLDDSTGTPGSGDTGSGRIGTPTMTGTPLSFTGDYVDEGLYYLFNNLNLHMSGTNWRHEINHIDGKAVVHVDYDDADAGDYATITAAITALDTVGGTIFVKKTGGNIGETVSLSTVTKPINIICTTPGTKLKGTVVPGGGPVLGNNSARVTWRNFTFEGASTYPSYAYGGTGGLEFYDCTFTRESGNEGTGKYLLDTAGSGHIKCVRCTFDALDHTDGNYGFNNGGSTSNDFIQCTFHEISNRCIYVVGSANDFLHVRDCVFDACGNTPASASSPTTLITVLSNSAEHVDISGCEMINCIGTASGRWASIVAVNGIRVRGNKFGPGIQTANTGTHSYVLDLSSSTDTVIVSDNDFTLSATRGNGIEVTARHAVVTDNLLEDVAQTSSSTSQTALNVLCDNGATDRFTISNNIINSGVGGGNAILYGIVTDGAGSVSNNVLNVASGTGGTYGINCSNPTSVTYQQMTISGNIINSEPGDNYTGIYSVTDYTTISGNTILGTGNTGIACEGDYCTVTGNIVIAKSGIGQVSGIYCQNGESTIITGNTVKGTNFTSSIGIYSNATGIVHGNRILDWVTDINGTPAVSADNSIT